MSDRIMILAAADVTEAFVERFYEAAIEGWYDESAVDWEDALDRFEGGTDYDFGDSLLSPAITKLQREVRRIRRENGVG